jgi:hypothetical protein
MEYSDKRIAKLRNRQVLNLFSKKNKMFIKIQLNKKENFICWQMFYSLDKRNWVKQNEFLSLKDCKTIFNKII